MGRLRLAFASAVATCVLACFADLSGYSGGQVQPDGGAPDSAVDLPAEAEADAGADAPPVEAGPPACEPSVHVENDFTTSLDAFSPRSSVFGYPKVDSPFGSPSAVLLPVTSGPDAAVTQAHSGVWLDELVPLDAFDVEVDFRVECGSGQCGDGLVLAWLDSQNPALLDNKGEGHVAGLPDGVDGAGVFADNYTNTESSDPPPPTLQVISIDGTKPVGDYPWITTFKRIDFKDAWHTLGVRVRGGSVEVRYDGVVAMTSIVSSFAGDLGLFGFSAGTGSATDAVALRNFSASFYACTP